MSGTIHVLNGPNLGFLGIREPHIYGTTTLADVERECRAIAEPTGFDIVFRQTDAEHEMVHFFHDARVGAAGIVFNPAAFSYAAYPVYDALKMCDCPIVEVHISNIHRREEAWRSKSIMTQGVTGIVSGLGVDGYGLAVRHIIRLRSA
ncbi:type II 3-dehydroquinate dehydratase [Sphingomonas sp.]|uniref:type II 3-dehydroquinate dehydratase n=1 Tax=Sphingomonas sp. TaxID=28214 RepID=UPI000DB3161F|nr:type II 3-dehydroquinate dehydratase [Sphingomonas sp.]PZU08160.1 MAG: 3-dehydroquinate dehydratase [Sphingomonas sp.]